MPMALAIFFGAISLLPASAQAATCSGIINGLWRWIDPAEMHRRDIQVSLTEIGSSVQGLGNLSRPERERFWRAPTLRELKAFDLGQAGHELIAALESLPERTGHPQRLRYPEWFVAGLRELFYRGVSSFEESRYVSQSLYALHQGGREIRVKFDTVLFEVTHPDGAKSLIFGTGLDFEHAARPSWSVQVYIDDHSHLSHSTQVNLSDPLLEWQSGQPNNPIQRYNPRSRIVGIRFYNPYFDRP